MRNFLYNKSDILIAIIIIAVAAVIIWTRVDAIMNADEASAGSNAASTGDLSTPDSPETDVNTGDVPPPEGEGVVEDGTEAPPVTGDEGVGGEGEGEGEEGEGADPESEEPVEFTVAVGSTASVVADDLESSGLVESADVFLNELVSQGAETKLKAGTFNIKPGTSVAEIVKKLTN
jgi:hypothetical protein